MIGPAEMGRLLILWYFGRASKDGKRGHRAGQQQSMGPARLDLQALNNAYMSGVAIQINWRDLESV
jgi:hypothetical protein